MLMCGRYGVQHNRHPFMSYVMFLQNSRACFCDVIVSDADEVTSHFRHRVPMLFT